MYGGVLGFSQEPFLLGFMNFRNQRTLVYKFKLSEYCSGSGSLIFSKIKESPVSSFQKKSKTLLILMKAPV
jgi:hypothetical protein